MVVVGDDDTLTGLLDCGVDASRVGFSRAPARAVETVPTAVLIVLAFIVFACKVALIEAKRVEILSILEQNTAHSEGAKTDRISADEEEHLLRDGGCASVPRLVLPSQDCLMKFCAGSPIVFRQLSGLWTVIYSGSENHCR